MLTRIADLTDAQFELTRLQTMGLEAVSAVVALLVVEDTGPHRCRMAHHHQLTAIP